MYIWEINSDRRHTLDGMRVRCTPDIYVVPRIFTVYPGYLRCTPDIYVVPTLDIYVVPTLDIYGVPRIFTLYQPRIFTLHPGYLRCTPDIYVVPTPDIFALYPGYLYCTPDIYVVPRIVFFFWRLRGYSIDVTGRYLIEFLSQNTLSSRALLVEEHS